MSLNSVLRARLEALPEQARSVLDVLAVLSRPVDSSLVASMVAMADATTFRDVLERLHGGAWVRAAGDRHTIQCYHDRDREVVAAMLSPERRQELNLRIARTLAEVAGPPDLIAESFLAAGEKRLATAHARRAAELAGGQLAFEQAARWYRLALRLDEGEERSTLRERLGMALLFAGRAREASAMLVAAAEEAEALRSLQLRRLAASGLIAAGFSEEGLAMMTQILGEVGHGASFGRVESYARTVSGIARLHLKTPALHRGGAPDPRQEVLFEALLDTGAVMTLLSPFRSMAANLLSLDVSRRLRSVPMQVCAFAGCACVLANSRPGHELLELCRREVRRGAGQAPQVAVYVDVASALFDMFNGDVVSARQRYEEVLARGGWSQHRAFALRTNAEFCHLWVLNILGEVRAAGKTGAERHRTAEAADRIVLLWGSDLTANFYFALAEGEVARARRCLSRWPGEGEAQQTLMKKAVMFLALYEDSEAEAQAAIEMFRAQRKVLPFFPLGAAEIGGLEALVGLAYGRGRARSLEQVERSARKIGKLPVLFAPAQAEALRAGVAARRKQFAKAERLFDDAVHGFDRASMKMHAAACRIRRGEILGGDEGRALIEAGEATMREEGVVKPEQFAQCYAPRFPLR